MKTTSFPAFVLARGRREEKEELLDHSDTHSLVDARAFALILCGDPYEIVRMKAYELLSKVGESRDRIVVERGFADRAWVVRASAYSAVADLNLKALVEKVGGFARTDPSPPARRYAADAYIRMRRTSAHDFLRTLIATEKSPEARAGFLPYLQAFGEDRYDAEIAGYENDNERLKSIVRDAYEGVNESFPVR